MKVRHFETHDTCNFSSWFTRGHLGPALNFQGVRRLTLPETNSSHLQIDGWKTILSFWDGLFSGAMLVSGRVLWDKRSMAKSVFFWEKFASWDLRSANFWNKIYQEAVLKFGFLRLCCWDLAGVQNSYHFVSIFGIMIIIFVILWYLCFCLVFESSKSPPTLNPHTHTHTHAQLNTETTSEGLWKTWGVCETFLCSCSRWCRAEMWCKMLLGNQAWSGWIFGKCWSLIWVFPEIMVPPNHPF